MGVKEEEEEEENDDKEEEGGSLGEDRGNGVAGVRERGLQLRVVPRFVCSARTRWGWFSFEARRAAESVNSGFLYPLPVVQDEV